MLGAPSTERPQTSGRLTTAAASASAVLVAVFWSIPTTLYCWDGAYNVSLGDPTDWTVVAVLFIMGLVPWAVAAGYFVVMRRRHSAASALTFATIVLAVVTLPVLILRVMFGAPF